MRLPREVCGLALALATACGHASPRLWAAGAPSEATALEPGDALAELESRAGPRRFAMLSPRLYRGGQPTPRHLALLHALGVTRVVDLRKEGLGLRRAQARVARQLGLQMLEYPFYGVLGAEIAFLDRLLEELERDDGAAIYVHCSDGRDRTGLVMALHRVVNEGWDPQRAWHHEVLAYGHRPSLFVREIALTFADHVQEHEMRSRSRQAAPGRRHAMEARWTMEGGSTAVVPPPHEAPSSRRAGTNVGTRR